MRLLLLNLRTDVDHTALGFTSAWINAIAPAWERVDVVTMHVGRLDVADNVHVHSMGRESGVGRAGRVLRFYRHVGRVLARERPAVVFSHMSPLMAAMATPAAKAAGVPVLLWYAHGNVTKELKVAHALVDRAATSTPNGFRLASDKLVVLGQGVDTDRFAPPAEPAPPGRMLSLGRITAAKGLDESLEAVALLRETVPGVHLRVVGGPVGPLDAAYEQELHAEAAGLGLDDHVEFTGPVPYAEIAEQYHQGRVFLNLSSTGSLDKAILEAMASGCIPVSRNDSFAALAGEHGFERLVPGPGADAAAAVLAEVLALPVDEQAALRAQLRSVVVEGHSLERLAGLVNAELQALAATGRNAG